MKKPSDNKLYSYKMTHDNRFAPNPLHGVLTLATCKPGIRRNTQIGNWIAGWSSKQLEGCFTEIGEEKLIYLARVTDKIPYAQYWEKYPQKRPYNIYNKDSEGFCGDNIYQPSDGDPSGFIQLKNGNHKEEHKAHDLKGKNVLICTEFYYFGRKQPLDVPQNMRPNVPKVQTAYGMITPDASEFINFVRQNADKCHRKN